MLNLLFISGHLLARSFRLLQHLSLLMMLPVEKDLESFTPQKFCAAQILKIQGDSLSVSALPVL